MEPKGQWNPWVTFRALFIKPAPAHGHHKIHMHLNQLLYLTS